MVNVDPRYELAERVHVLVQELGHIRCGHNGREESQAQRENEAESVAFIVSTVLGLTVGDVTAVYVGGCTDGDPDTIATAQAAIHTTARGLLGDLEDHSNWEGEQAPTGLSPPAGPLTWARSSAAVGRPPPEPIEGPHRRGAMLTGAVGCG